jgi:bifunctional UDP-N-acetylglucosamine pyrophosphorylase/glucosamine-1-phosphate N-acetyltransferase
VVQHPAKGTGDAVRWAVPHLKDQGYVLVLYGDTPLVRKETLDKMMNKAQHHPEMAVILLGMHPKNPQHYARLLLNKKGELEEVIEEKDLTVAQREISLCNSGVMLIRADLLNSLLSALTPDNAANEYYLPDLVKIARKMGYSCGVVEGEESEFMGINTRQDLAKAEYILQDRWRDQAMTAGVTLKDPHHIYFSYDTQLASDVTLHSFVILGPGVVIEKGAEILPFCQLSNTHVGPRSVIGPFAHLRGGVRLQDEVEIGNFVEVKKSTFGSKSKAKHLSYIGDAEVGAETNIGAGTITCNYNGFKKSKTNIGEGVFIGSNSCLIAPVSIGDYAIVGAGSVVTQNVESHALALARGKQTTFEKGADTFREKHQIEKDL